MRRFIFLSLAILSVMTLLITSFAFAGEKKASQNDKNVIVVSKSGTYLGIYMDDLDDNTIDQLDYPKSTGVWVTGVVDDSPAEEAGIKEDDVIYTIDGEKVRSTSQLARIIHKKDPGDKIDVVLYRDGDKKKLEVKLAEQSKKYMTFDADVFKNDPGFEMGKFRALNDMRSPSITIESKGALGVSVHDINSDLAGYFGVKAGEGVLVLDVVEDGAADKAGIKSGDVITKVAGEKIEGIKDLQEAISDLDDDNDTLAVTVIRKGDKKEFNVEAGDLTWYGDSIMISPSNPDYFKHFKLSIPEISKDIKIESLDQKKIQDELQGNIDKLRNEIQTLEKRLKKLEKQDRD